MDNIKLVVLDLDKTILEDTSWLRLNLAMGMTKEEDDSMLQSYIDGDLDYQSWQKQIAKIYIKRGKASKRNIENALFKYKYTPGVLDFIDYLHEKNYQLALVSGSIDLLVAHIAGELKIDNWFANNKFIFSSNNYLSEIVTEGDDGPAKLNYIKSLVKKLKISPKEVASIGDGENDLELFEYTGNGITFTGSKLRAQAAYVIKNFEEMKEIL